MVWTCGYKVGYIRAAKSNLHGSIVKNTKGNKQKIVAEMCGATHALKEYALDRQK